MKLSSLSFEYFCLYCGVWKLFWVETFAVGFVWVFNEKTNSDWGTVFGWDPKTDPVSPDTDDPDPKGSAADPKAGGADSKGGGAEPNAVVAEPIAEEEGPKTEVVVLKVDEDLNAWRAGPKKDPALPELCWLLVKADSEVPNDVFLFVLDVMLLKAEEWFCPAHCKFPVSGGLSGPLRIKLS